MSITGSKESGPTRAGFAVCDAIGGMTLAFGVSSALYQRTHTGRGQMVDVAMLDAAMTFMSSFFVDYTVGGHVQGPSGNRAQSRLPTADLFKVKGGHILLAVNNEKQFLGAVERHRPSRSAEGSALRRLAGAHRQRGGAAPDHRGCVRRRMTPPTGTRI